MITDLIRNNLVAVVTGAIVGTATLGSGTIYVVYQDGGGTAAEAPRITAFPSRFVFEYDGKVGLVTVGKFPDSRYEPVQGHRTTSCDLTVEADGSCSMEVGKYGVFPHIAIIAPHAGDRSVVSLRIRTLGGSEPLTGLSWDQLAKGVAYEGGVFSVKPIGGRP